MCSANPSNYSEHRRQCRDIGLSEGFATGKEEQSVPAMPNDRFTFGKQTVVVEHANGSDAPNAATRPPGCGAEDMLPRRWRPGTTMLICALYRQAPADVASRAGLLGNHEQERPEEPTRSR